MKTSHSFILFILALSCISFLPELKWKKITDSKNTGTNNQDTTKVLDCTCEDTSIQKNIGFAPSLESLVSERDLNNFGGLPFHTKGNFYEHIFYRYFINDYGYNHAILMVYKPIMLEMDSKSFTFNLTPCTIEQYKFTELSVTLYYSGISRDDDNNLIPPSIKVSLDTKIVGIILDTTILRTWNETSIDAYRDSEGRSVGPQILLEVNGIDYRTDYAFDFEAENLCFPRSEISSTGVLVDFNSAIVDGDEKSNPYEIGRTEQPFFTHFDTVLVPECIVVPGFKTYYTGDSIISFEPKYDTALEKFTGLFVTNGEIYFLKNGEYKAIEAHDMLLNNYFISGMIYIKDLSTVSVSQSEFIQVLEQKGFETLQKQVYDDTPALFFRYKVNE